MDSAASGSWESYCVAGEHMHVANSFLNTFMKMVIFFLIFASWMTNLNIWIPDNWEFPVLATSFHTSLSPFQWYTGQNIQFLPIVSEVRQCKVRNYFLFH
jgi:hypothetical protein